MDTATVQDLVQQTLRLRQESTLLEVAGAKMVARSRELRAEHRDLLTHVRQLAREQVQGSLRRTIRRKLFSGHLPYHSASTISGGPGNGGMCEVCDRPLTAAQLGMDVPLPDTVVRLHADCFLLWDDERRKVTGVLNGVA